MTAIIYVGQHEVRLLPPALFYVRCQGNVTAPEVQQVAQLARQHLAGRDGQLLVDVAALGHLDQDSRTVLSSVDEQALADCGHIYDIVFLHGRLLQKVILAQVVSLAARHARARVGIYFFDSLEDALDWLELPPSALLG